MKKPFSWIDYKELALFDYPFIIKDCCAFFETGLRDSIVTFDLYVRELPKNRNFLLFMGLEDILKYILELRYSEKDIAFLLKNRLITKGFAKYLKNYKFSGEVYAMQEGTIFFPDEPVIRITAPIIEANLMSTMLVNLLFSNTTIASKLIRLNLVKKNKKIGVGFIRTYGIDAAIKSQRIAYILDLDSPALIGSKEYDYLPGHVGLACHAFIKTYPTELDSFRAFTKVFKHSSSMMVDTYNVKEGLKNAVFVAKELETKKGRLDAVVLDSGDILKQSKFARKFLDNNGLDYVKIVGAGNLDEFKIEEFEKKGSKIDIYLTGTETANSSDSPTTEVVYKMSEITTNGEKRPTMKLASKKVSLPGKKQVYRIGNKENIKDIIGLEKENLGTPLLKPMIKKGKLVYNIPSLISIRGYIYKQLSKMPERLLDINKQHNFIVQRSKKLNSLIKKIKTQHKKFNEL